jgi:hypothetical protein
LRSKNSGTEKNGDKKSYRQVVKQKRQVQSLPVEGGNVMQEHLYCDSCGKEVDLFEFLIWGDYFICLTCWRAGEKSNTKGAGKLPLILRREKL